jgi:hypothetical protein
MLRLKGRVHDITLHNGFFWKIRQGSYDKSDFNRALSQIASVPSQNGGPLPARLVSLLWYVPIFMEWQRERIREKGGNVEEFVCSMSRCHSDSMLKIKSSSAMVEKYKGQVKY